MICTQESRALPRVLCRLPSLPPRRVLWAAVCVATILLVSFGHRVLNNCHTVLPAQVYRCAQLSAQDLGRYMDAHGIKTIVNLRGDNSGSGWYQDERALAMRKGARYYDVAIDSGNPPSGSELRRLVTVLETCPKPVCLHCRSGIDRTSMASAIAILLLKDHASCHDALAEFSFWYGCWPWRENADKQESIVRDYEAWLTDTGNTHRPATFERWLLDRFAPIN